MSDIPKLSDSRIEQRFHREGETLRIEIQADDRGELKKSAAKNGWFLTADYSTTPPRVILTKEESKYSHWVFIPVNANNARIDGNYIDCFVRNDNDLGKPAWLSIEKEGVLKMGPQIASNQTVADICRVPILSVEHKTKFEIAHSDGK